MRFRSQLPCAGQWPLRSLWDVRLCTQSRGRFDDWCVCQVPGGEFQEAALEFQEAALEFQEAALEFEEAALEFQEAAPEFQEAALEFQESALGCHAAH